MAEAFYHLRRSNPSAPERRIESWRERLDVYFPEAKVTHWDPKSVPPPRGSGRPSCLAAAYAGEADILITSDGDIGNFQRCLDEADAGISVLHVDEFLCLIADRYPELVRRR